MSTSTPLLTSADFWLSVHTVLAWIFLVLDLALLVGFVYAFRKIIKFRPHELKPGERHPTGMASPQITVFRERWEAVMRRFDLNSPEAMRFSILEADILVDAILKDSGLEGENLADRLAKVTPESIQSLNQLWKSHRLRNKLAETSEYELSAEEAQSAIQGYEAFLKEIKIL
ncbi:MAG: hypothetical protein FJY98_02670 [Candidatus Liptonbacteria bacterium]|nr:hypothetical protein [Candidatus Liptonbacteria bacterium]